MNLDAQEFLDLVEETRRLVFFDIESMSMQADYGSVLCASFKPFKMKPFTFHINEVGNDKDVVIAAKNELESYSCWCSHYGKGFDIKFLNTRLLKWGEPPIEKRPHVDLFFVTMSALQLGRKSQAHLNKFFGTKEKKMSVSPNVWSEIPFKFDEHMSRVVKRCESDVRGLECNYIKLRKFIRDVKR